MTRLKNLRSPLRLALFCTACSSSTLFAASATWNGATDALWSTDTNWSATPVPGTGDTATFNNAGNANTTLTTGSITINSIDLSGPNAAAYTFGASIGAETITVNSGGRIRVFPSVLRNQAVNNNVLLSGNYNFDAFSPSSTLAFSGAVSTSAAATLSLRGTGAGVISGAINNGSAVLSLSKVATGSWTLSGANTFTGALTIQQGRIVADYSAGNNVFNDSAPTKINLGIIGTGGAVSNAGGILVFKGQPTGTTADTVGNIEFSSTTNKLIIDNNGGAVTTITIGNTITRTNASGFLNFDTSAGGTFVIGAGTLGGALLNKAPGDLLDGAITVVTGNGRGDFATFNADREIVRLNAATDLPLAGGGGATSDFRVISDAVLSATPQIRTVRFDTSVNNAPIVLSTGALGFNGGNFLFEGNHDVTIEGAANASTTTFTTTLSTLGAATYTVTGAVTTGAGEIRKTGDGLLVLTGAQNNTGAVRVSGGVLRAQNAALGAGNLTLSGEGVFEIAADLNGAVAGDFSRSFAAGTAGAISFLSDAGLSARGGDRVFVAGGATPQALTWNTTAGFFTSSDSKLILSSPTSDAKITFGNAINFNNAQRLIEVRNGSAAVDAALSGVLSGPGVSGLTKTGAGALEVTAANTYAGDTAVMAGTLLANSPSGSATGAGNVLVGAGAILGGSGVIAAGGAAGTLVQSGGMLAPGVGLGVLSFDSLNTTATNVLSLSADAIFRFELGAELASDRLAVFNASAGDILFGGNTLHFTDLTAGNLVAGAYTLFTSDLAGAYSGLILDGGNFITGGLSVGEGLGSYGGSKLQLVGNDIVLHVVPEPGSALALLSGLGTLLGLKRFRRRGL